MAEWMDNSPAVLEKMQSAVRAFLHDAGGEIVGEIVKNSRTDTGQTKNAYAYRLDENGTEQMLTVGSPLMNAIYEEFGTGEYALKGGRKGGWWIRVGDGKGQISEKTAKRYKWAGYRYESGEISYGKRLRQGKKRGKLAYVFTFGKRPNKPMQKAYDKLRDPIQKQLRDTFGTAFQEY